MSALSDLLTAANTRGLSARSVSREAQLRGHTLNHDTAARYLRGAHGVPDEATLRAFADVFEVPMTRLRAAADLPSELVEPYEPPPESSRLTRRQRRAVDEIIRAMLDPAPSRRQAARRGEPDRPTTESRSTETAAAEQAARSDADPSPSSANPPGSRNA